MEKATIRLILGASLAVAAFGQGTPLPFGPTLLNNNGLPNAGGVLCSYLNGGSVPSPMYTSVTLTQALPTCAPLDSSGRIFAFLNPAISYTLVLQNNVGVTLWTINGIQIANPTIVSPWGLNGSTVFNNAGTGVCISPTDNCNLALSLLNLQGSSTGSNQLLRIDDASGKPGMALYANGVAAGAYSANSGGLRLLDGTGLPQMTVAPGQVVIQNSDGPSTTLTVSAGGTQGAAYLTQWIISGNSPATWVDASGNIVAPLFNSTAAGASIAYQTSNSNFSVDGNGDVSADGTLNVVGATNVTTNPLGRAFTVNGPSSPVAIIDNLGNATVTSLTCTGTPCGSGGGGSGTPGGAITQVQYNNPAGTFAGTSDFTFTHSTHLLTVYTTSGAAGMAVGTGYMQADGGFLGTTGTCNSYNCFQAPTGGMVAANFDASQYVRLTQTSGSSVRPTLTTGETSALGILYFDGGGSIQVCTAAAGTTCNTWTSLAAGSSAAFGSLTSGTNTAAAMVVGSGSSLTVSGSGTNNANLFNGGTAPASGSLWASNGALAPVAATGATVASAFTGCSGSVPYLTYTGGCGTGGGGGGAVSSITGSANQVGANGNFGSIAQTGPVVLTLPQPIGTTSGVVFGSVQAGTINATTAFQINGTTVINPSNQFVGAAVNTTGVVQSQVTGGAVAFQTSGSTFIVDGNGATSIAGNLNLTSGAVYQMAGTQVINTAAQFIGNAVNVAGVVQSQVTGCGSGNPAFQTSNTKFSVDGCGDVSMVGALAADGGITTLSSSNSVLFVGSFGNFYNRTTGGSAGISCGGVNNGWTAITSDNYVVVCNSGARYRALLSSY